MAESAYGIQHAIEKLQQLPKELHYFCPRCGEDDQSLYFDEDLQPDALEAEEPEARVSRKKRVDEVIKRKNVVLEALPIFAFDGPDALPKQQWLKKRLEDLMTKCDVCIRLYHALRRELKHNLEMEYHEDEVTAFMVRFDTMNFDRISSGLDHAAALLRALPQASWRITALDTRGMFAIFEVLSCEPYLQNEGLMKKHFDETFEMVCSKKKPRLPTYTPAVARFLFCQNKHHFDWAMMMWQKKSLKRSPTSFEFDWCIQPSFLEAMRKAQVINLKDFNDLPCFWNGARTIIARFDKNLITHSLRALDIDIYKMALDTFHIPELTTANLIDVLTTVQTLLELSPKDFWDAMKAISPATVVEQIFNCVALERILLRADEAQLKLLFTWIWPFLDSIKLLNQTPACRSLTNQLLSRSQNPKYPAAARASCLTAALGVLYRTLANLSKGDKVATFVGAACVADMLQLVDAHIITILIKTKGAQNGKPQSEDTDLALKVIEQALVLDSLALVMDRDTVLRQKFREQANGIRSESLWNTIARYIKPGNQALATHVLLGAQKLLGVERFGPKFQTPIPDDPKLFNAAYEAKCSFVCNILERLSAPEFSAFELAGLFKTAETASGVVATLLSSDDATRQAAVEMLERLGETTGRREAIGKVLQNAYLSTILAINQYIIQVTQKKIFTPVSSMIKLCSDVVDVLTNTQDGILRARDLEVEELKATEAFWKGTWQALVIVFDTTEHWSTVGHDKTSLMDFCRDTMQFAESLFDGYSVFVSAVRDEVGLSEQQNRTHAIQLLRFPRDTMSSMVKWLRLRDEYLADKIVKVVSSLLLKLGKADIEVSATTLDTIQNVTDGTIKTKLSFPQINELVQALEKHTGRSVAPPPRVEQRKPGAQSSISAWATSGRDSDATSDADRRVFADATQAQARFKLEQAKKRAAAIAVAQRQPPKNVINEAAFKSRRAAEMEEKKKRDAQAIARAKQLRGDLAGAGSALGTLGVKGKDHAKGTGMMVSSDEESEEDDDDLDKELFGLTNRPKRAKVAPNGMPTKLIPEVRGPVKIKRQVRSFKDMRARLAPDLAPLHKEILSWDFFSTSSLPPGSRASNYVAVADTFRDPVSYKTTFLPLHTIEAWSGLVKAREENSNRPYDIKIITRSTVDSFVEISTTLTHADNIEVSIMEGDIILLSKATNPATASESPNCLARVAKVSRKKQFLEVLYRIVPGNKLMSSLNPNGMVRGIKIQSMTSLEREYGALAGLQYYDLCDYILKAEPSRLLNYTDKQLEPFMGNYSLNKAQAKAVRSAIDNDAFTLIQGPPGSGKTKTITAIVGALLTDTLRDNGTAVQAPRLHGQPQQEIPTAKKLLVCAPSNAAVDELVMRFKAGIKTRSGQLKKVNIVRLGRGDAINSNVRDVMLDELVNAKLSGVSKSNEKDKSREEKQKIMTEHKEISERLREVRVKLDSDEYKGPEAVQIKEEFEALRRRKTQLGSQVEQAFEKEKTMNRTADLERKRAQQDVLNNAHVICGTLSGSGHDMFQNLNIEFESVVVDEAAQCVELSALIPLKYGCAKCILVGDPKQLPPTVFSQDAKAFLYEQSLFVRMQKNHPDDIHLLDTQYRMHPEISVFPSNAFYDGRLIDGPDMAGLRERPWHSQMLLGPYRFFDVQGQHSSATKGHSLVNYAEIDVALRLFDKLMKACGSSYDLKGKVGIITPYKSQLRELKSKFIARHGQGITETIEFNTTDAFQGRESEVIIFSCVRASETGGVGFMADIRRMNVGITRAKSSLWVLGNSDSLMRGKYWAKLIQDAKKRDRHSPATLITSIDTSKSSSNAAYGPNNAPTAPLKALTVPAKKQPDMDILIDDVSVSSSASSSRKSSVDKSADYKIQPAVKQEPSSRKPSLDKAADTNTHAVIKQELQQTKRKAIEIEDVDMQDASDLKEEKPIAKPDTSATGSAGYLVKPRAPAQIVKRRKAPANPLLQPNRPKKPKTG